MHNSVCTIILLNTEKTLFVFALIALNLKKFLAMAGGWNKMIFKVLFCDSMIANLPPPWGRGINK